MVQVLIGIQVVAMVLLVAEILYVSFQRPSRLQLKLNIMLCATFVALLGHLWKTTATTQEAAIMGLAFSYVGKPISVMAQLLFIMEYCKCKVNRKLLIPWAIFCVLLGTAVLTNDYHHLYYTSFGWDETKEYAKLILTRGPLYYLNMANTVATFAASLALSVRAFVRAKTSVVRRQSCYLIGMMLCLVLGYVFYLTGISIGYDTTMTAGALSSVFLTVLFVRYRLFDYMTLAIKQSLDQASNGLWVLDTENEVTYSNQLTRKLASEGFTTENVINLPDGKSVFEKNERFYEVINTPIIERGRSYGRTVEISDITERHNYSQMLEKEVEKRTAEIQQIHQALLDSFAGLVEARDSSTGEHINRMKEYVSVIGTELLKEKKYADVLDEDYLSAMVYVAPLHDIGKLCIPDVILNKPARLTPEEFEIIKTHTTEGDRIVDESMAGVEREDYVKMAKMLALSHHEKWDGSGYPQRLSGEEIPLAARIAAVADVYDAIRSKRCYKDPMGTDEAKQVIIDGRGTHFDPVVVDAFLNSMQLIEKIAEK